MISRAFVDTVTKWCVAGAGAMLVLVVLTLFGNGPNVAMEPIRSRTYLSNFLIGGALTGVYAGLPADQRALIDRGEIGEYQNRSTGFGLNIVRLLARSYDGTLDPDSSDNGTTVTLMLRRGDTDEQTVRHGTGDTLSRRRLAVAAVASLVADGVMGGLLQVAVGTVPVIGALYGSADVWVGWLTHEFHSVVFGLIYVGLVTLVPETYGDGVRYYGVAIAWATGLWLVAASLVMPVWLRLVGISAMLLNLQSTLLAGHLVWGVTVATCYRVGRR